MAPKSVGASMLGNPDVPGFGVDGQALGVPVSVAPDFGKYIAFTHKGIVGGHASVVMEANDCAVVVRDILCGVGLQVSGGGRLRFSDRHEQVPLLIELEPSSVVARTTPGFRHEDVFDICESVILETPPGDRRRGVRTISISCDA